jgi:hypothetical protein
MTHRHRYTPEWLIDHESIVLERCALQVPEKDSIADGLYGAEYLQKRGGMLDCGRERLVIVSSRLAFTSGRYGLGGWNRLPTTQVDRIVVRARETLQRRRR